ARETRVEGSWFFQYSKLPDFSYNPIAWSLLLHYHRRAIAQHFAHALHDLGGIVAHADYGIGAHLRGVLQHKLEGLFARPFAQFSEQADVAADQGLKAGPQSSNDRARSHGNAPHNS